MRFKRYLLLAGLFLLMLADGELNPAELQLLLAARARGNGYLIV